MIIHLHLKTYNCRFPGHQICCIVRTDCQGGAAEDQNIQHGTQSPIHVEKYSHDISLGHIYTLPASRQFAFNDVDGI